MTDEEPAFRPPQWAKPAPLGYGAAADAAQFVAAPLLASGSLALIGVVAADSDKFRWAAPAMLVLSLAAVGLIASIQFGFQSRALLYSGADLAAWWGEDDITRYRERLRRQQRADHERWRAMNFRAVTTYNVGVALLGFGVATCLAPMTSNTADGRVRWVACALVAAAGLAEAIYALAKLRLPLGRS
ncbi:hypothetical protein [Nocardia xishanensis]